MCYNIYTLAGAASSGGYVPRHKKASLLDRVRFFAAQICKNCLFLGKNRHFGGKNCAKICYNRRYEAVDA